jgi:hypothetical protein
MNWEKMTAQQQLSEQNGRVAGDREKSPYVKFTPGTCYIRPLPVGNYEEDLPYKSITQHSVFLSENGKQVPFFAMCWSWLFSTQAISDSTAKPLGKMQRLVSADYDLYTKHGCPFCKAAQALDASGFDKQVVRNLMGKSTNLWNIVVRTKNPRENSDELFVWNMSNKIHNSVLSMVTEMYNSQQLDPLDVVTGYDWMVIATGEKLQRRYDINMVPKVKELGGQFVPYNLMELAAKSFMNYQSTIDLVKKAVGNSLNEIGYKIPGDMTFQTLTDTTPVIIAPPPYVAPVPTVPTSPAFAGAAVANPIQTGIANANASNVPPWTQPTAVVTAQAAHVTPQDGFDPVTNTVYKNGKALF